VWDAATGAHVHDLEGPGGAIEWVAWHPKGSVLLAGSDDMTAWMWLAGTGQCMQAS
jgi:angio-associated migratory cell protein